MKNIPKNNAERRYDRWAEHSVVYRILTGIPFHIINWVLAEIEFNFCPQCPWCGRQYFSGKKSRECCADIKASRGRYPGMSYVNGGSSYYGGSIEYDAYGDRCINRTTGKTYTPNDR